MFPKKTYTMVYCNIVDDWKKYFFSKTKDEIDYSKRYRTMPMPGF